MLNFFFLRDKKPGWGFTGMAITTIVILKNRSQSKLEPARSTSYDLHEPPGVAVSRPERRQPRPLTPDGWTRRTALV